MSNYTNKPFSIIRLLYTNALNMYITLFDTFALIGAQRDLAVSTKREMTPIECPAKLHISVAPEAVAEELMGRSVNIIITIVITIITYNLLNKQQEIYKNPKN